MLDRFYRSLKDLEEVGIRSQKGDILFYNSNCVTNKKTINGTNTDWTGYYKTLPSIKETKKRKKR